MSSVLVVGAAALTLAGCGSSSKSAVGNPPPSASSPNAAAGGVNGYTAAVKHDFLTSCERGTPAAACECMIAYLQGHVSYQTLRVDVTKNQANSQYIQRAAHSCKK